MDFVYQDRSDSIGTCKIMSNNTNLQKQKKQKNDEFYTQLTDIEKELRHYEKYFKNKTILCNCDDPRVSNFFKYFSLNFEKLKLKKLITTCYKSQNMDSFTQLDSNKGLKLEYDGDKNNNKMADVSEIECIKLESDGDFRSQECIEILKQADIVCTNPPFSLFREFIAQLEYYNKKYIIIGNQNAITYKEVFPLIQKNKLWLGVSIHSGDREFGIPDEYIPTSASLRVDEAGKKFVRVVGVRWFTNLDYQERHDELFLFKKYNKIEYPTYDNYNAINVTKTKWIPKNYDGIMGVPITFLDKYSPDQFEVLGCDYQVRGKILSELVNPNYDGKLDRGYIDGKRLYSRIFIKRKGKIK